MEKLPPWADPHQPEPLDWRDFVQHEGGGVSLTPGARKTLVVVDQERKKDEINHRLLSQSVPRGLVPLVQKRLISSD